MAARPAWGVMPGWWGQGIDEEHSPWVGRGTRRDVLDEGSGPCTVLIAGVGRSLERRANQPRDVRVIAAASPFGLIVSEMSIGIGLFAAPWRHSKAIRPVAPKSIPAGR